MIPLHWICQQPTPYNDHLFRAIAADAEIDLTVHFMYPVVETHPWASAMAVGFKSRTYQRRLGVDWTTVRDALSGDGYFIIAGWHEPTVQLCIGMLRARGRRFALLTDTPKVGWEYGRSRVKGLLRSAFLRFAFPGAERVFGTGCTALERLQDLGCDAEKLVNLPYFIDLDVYRPGARQSTAIDDEIVFLSSGRLVNAIKAHDVAIRVLAKAQKGNPRLRIRYRIAGVGPDEEMLRVLANDLNVNLELLSWLEPDELGRFYRSGDVLLHPSHHDAYATSVLEAMATGLAVVGSDETGAVVDRIVHGQNGLVHRRGDEEHLLAQVTRLCQRIHEIRDLGEAARHTALQWPATRGVEIVKGVVLQRPVNATRQPSQRPATTLPL